MQEQEEGKFQMSELNLVTPSPDQWRQRKSSSHLTSNKTWTILLGVVLGVVLVFAILITILRLALHNTGTKKEVIPIHPPTGSGQIRTSAPSHTSKCKVHQMMKTFSGSEDYCKSRNARLLNEEDIKAASLCITRGEDFWAAPVSRNPSECFIYNTDHGFVQMDCLTLRWFICLEP
ncbi:uncharacterized protein RB166_004606 [Leptodactylus fuscus]